MRTGRTLLAALVGVALIAAGWMPPSVLAQPASVVTIPDQYVVVLRPGANPRAEAQAAGGRGAQVLHVYEHAVRGFAFRGSAQAAQALARNPNVLLVQADREVRAVEQALPTGVDRVGADENGTALIDRTDQRVAVNVAVIDTGIDLGHSDLAVAGGVNCSRGASYTDGHGHGTHVAGTIGAIDNQSGVVGVAPGARLWAVRVLNNAGSGSWSDVICGIDWVTGTRSDGNPDNDIAVANMSLGGGGSDSGTCASTADALKLAICGSRAAGIVYVVAAGNDGQDAGGFVPAAYAEAVMTVSAVADSDGRPGRLGPATSAGADDTLAAFSNFGRAVDIAAPGVDILSTCKGGGTCRMSGTSMASPHVAGVVALYIADPDHEPATNAAGVDAIVAAVTAPGGGSSVDQAGPLGFVDRDDGDAEPMAYVGSGTVPPPPPPPQAYTLTVGRAGNGRGTVTSTSPSVGINCGFDCSESYAANTTVTLTASPARGSALAGWSGCDSTSGLTCTVTMTGKRSVTATFTR